MALPDPEKAKLAFLQTGAGKTEAWKEPTNPSTLQYIELFLRTLRDVMPEKTFAARDVVAWAAQLKEGLTTTDDLIPDELFSAYHVGKILRKEANGLGIANIGTYGNRQVYRLIEESANV